MQIDEIEQQCNEWATENLGADFKFRKNELSKNKHSMKYNIPSIKSEKKDAEKEYDVDEDITENDDE